MDKITLNRITRKLREVGREHFGMFIRVLDDKSNKEIDCFSGSIDDGIPFLFDYSIRGYSISKISAARSVNVGFGYKTFNFRRDWEYALCITLQKTDDASTNIDSKLISSIVGNGTNCSIHFDYEDVCRISNIFYSWLAYGFNAELSDKEAIAIRRLKNALFGGESLCNFVRLIFEIHKSDERYVRVLWSGFYCLYCSNDQYRQHIINSSENDGIPQKSIVDIDEFFNGVQKEYKGIKDEFEDSFEKEFFDNIEFDKKLFCDYLMGMIITL